MEVAAINGVIATKRNIAFTDLLIRDKECLKLTNQG